jgi:4-amino-4-deoxy-L-arabinose transferase-like glycosyltransferase
MAPWLQSVLAVAAVIVVAPAVVWLARRLGGRVKGGIALAGVLLGFGVVMDPPSKHLIEATEPEGKEAPTPGDPPTPV